MKDLDSIDRSILRELQKDGRISNKDLADQVGLSSAPCWQRHRRLENDGVIEGYSANLNLEKLGFGEIVLLEVQLQSHDKQSVRAFGAEVAKIPEVLEVYLTTGGFDYFIKVAVDGTRGYERFLQERLYQIPGIQNTRSVFTLRCFKRNSSVSL